MKQFHYVIYNATINLFLETGKVQRGHRYVLHRTEYTLLFVDYFFQARKINFASKDIMRLRNKYFHGVLWFNVLRWRMSNFAS